MVFKQLQKVPESIL